MASIAWLTGPYLSLLVLRRWRWSRACVARHSGLTLPLGWVAVLTLSTALVGLWDAPAPVLAVCAASSGLSMLTPRRRDGDDHRPDDGTPDDPPPPGLDWIAFDGLRREWARERGDRVPTSR